MRLTDLRQSVVAAISATLTRSSRGGAVDGQPPIPTRTYKSFRSPIRMDAQVADLLAQKVDLMMQDVDLLVVHGVLAPAS